jgi:hypothetical protein
MGTSNIVTQRGNSTVTWILEGGDVGLRDLIVTFRTYGGNSGIKIEDVASFANGNRRYEPTTTVVGPDPVKFALVNWKVPT